MDFQLTDEQKLLKRTLREFARKELRPRAARWDETGEYPWENVKRLAQLGVTGLAIPPEYGGQGGSGFDVVLAMEEVAWGCANTAMLLMSGVGICAQAIAQYGSPDQKARYLPPLARGDAVAAIAMTEPDAGSATSRIASGAVRRGDRYLVNGRKCWITRSGVAETYVVFVRFDKIPGIGGVGAVILEKGMPGLHFGSPDESLGFRGCPFADLIMEGVEIGEEHVLVREGAFRKLMAAFNGQRSLNGAMSLGIAQAALDDTLGYVQERQLYGKPIADFQGIQWQLATMATRLEAARLLVYRAVANGAGGFPSLIEASMAKLFANETALEITDLCLQLHGGYGYTEAFPLGRYLRDARGMAIGGGPPQLQRSMIAAELLKRGFPLMF
jgi:alkylation response protein AidB-like acyl-CoA dehydrogenase